MPRLETPSDEAITYRPLASLAVVGLLLGMISPLLFLLNSAWFLFFVPVLGLILCVVARRHIRRSEGRLAGEHVATVGIVLCVACGLGWFTAQVTEQYIIAWEAETYLRDWIATLQTPDKEGEAFLGTMEPKSRQINFSPNDLRRLRAHFPPPRGTDVPAVELFLAHPFVGMVLRYPGQVQLRPLGRRDAIKYDRGVYTVEYAYYFACPVVEGEVLFTLHSEFVQTSRGQRREWKVFVFGEKPVLPNTVTEYGKAAHAAEQNAARWLGDVMQHIHVDNMAELNDLFAPDSQAGLRELVAFIRKDCQPKQPSTYKASGPFLLHDERVGANGWKLHFRVVVLAGKSEMVFEADLTTADLTDPKLARAAKRWRISGYKFVSYRKKREVEGAMPQMPDPRFPDKPN